MADDCSVAEVRDDGAILRRFEIYRHGVPAGRAVDLLHEFGQRAAPIDVVLEGIDTGLEVRPRACVRAAILAGLDQISVRHADLVTGLGRLGVPGCQRDPRTGSRGIFNARLERHWGRVEAQLRRETAVGAGGADARDGVGASRGEGLGDDPAGAPPAFDRHGESGGQQ